MEARQQPEALNGKQNSELIIELAPYLEDFIGHLFGIEAELRELQFRHAELAPLYSVKRRFVQRKALTGYTVERAMTINGLAVGAELEALMQEPLTRRALRSTLHAGLRPSPNTLSICSLRLSTQLGPRSRRKARRSTSKACCSKCRTSSIHHH